MSEDLSKEQKRVLVLLLDSVNKSAYDCQTTMRTMEALAFRNLIKKINKPDEIVWGGWERSTKRFALTMSGKTLAEKLKELKLNGSS